MPLVEIYIYIYFIYILYIYIYIYNVYINTYIYIYILHISVNSSHDYHLVLYVGSLKFQFKSFLFEAASSQYHFLINVLYHSKHQ